MSSKPFLIGIAGASGSGKSELARQLALMLQAPVISLDSYYIDLGQLSYEQRCAVNFDEPASLDAPLLLHHFSEIAEGRPVEVPEYDFSIHTRSAKVARIVPGRFVILEGLFALHWAELRELFGVRAFVELPEDVCFARRLQRDVKERGRTPESVKQQYFTTVKPMCDLHILPTRAHANIILRGDADLNISVTEVLSMCPEPSSLH
jgi:uridine kinase